ncbi:fasciclin domain-containing protein [Cumulibacter soli]|uniref:fasciclin domain-containing protein n=1 Tax=Cumulibacter soli TaxID=2546344 RepID=UPI001067F317|nr:fasciclin domain-containing protein [Cumulibacter soli]
MKRTLRGTAAAAIVALPLLLTACGSDSDSADTNGSSQDTSSEQDSDMGEDSSDEAMPEENGADEDGADAASMPFGPGCAAVPEDGAGSFDGMAADPVATAASNNPALSTLVSAVQAADLVDTLNSAEDITVFAPTDDAFGAVPTETLDAAMADPSGLLTTVLTNHVVEGRLAPDQLAGEHETLGGGTITVTGSGEDFMVGEASVVCGNVQTANATVYIIDQVLLPA